jgi:hypothetical protein
MCLIKKISVTFLALILCNFISYAENDNSLNTNEITKIMIIDPSEKVDTIESDVENPIIEESYAKEIITKKVPSATLISLNLNWDGTTPTYDATLVEGYTTYKISVHATKGSILNFSLETLDDAVGHWAEAAIFEFFEQGYISGYGDNLFKPNTNISRAEFVKILNKYFGLDSINNSRSSLVSFDDTKNHWAKNEIDIAVSYGIVNGVSQTEFRPDDPVTREQIAVMVANYLKISSTNHINLEQFDDSDNVSSWAKDKVEAMLKNGYLNGVNDTTLGAQDLATRAQAVTLLSRIKN